MSMSTEYHYPQQNEFFVYWSDGHHGERVEPFYARAPSIKSHRKGSYDIRSLNSDGLSVINWFIFT
ncbi:hypothetical protein Avbf_01996 [Armadillidium vulgare]|nr:hypothetical protein Avbf_01996 [Armadillidium vulgare]